MATFDDISKQLADIKAREAADAASAKQLEEEQKKAQERLSDVQERRSRLDNEESDAYNQLEAHKQTLAKLQDNQLKQSDLRKDLESQLGAAKQERNKQLIDWFMSAYPDFDTLTLTDLQNWMTLSAKRYRPSSISGGSGGTAKHLDPQDADQIAEEKVRDRDADEVKVDVSVLPPRTDDDLKNGTDNHTQTLDKKQRIFINQDENNPIDTQSEVEDAQEIESPLGNRDVHEEVDDYIDDHPEPTVSEKVKRHQTSFTTNTVEPSRPERDQHLDTSVDDDDPDVPDVDLATIKQRYRDELEL